MRANVCLSVCTYQRNIVGAAIVQRSAPVSQEEEGRQGTHAHTHTRPVRQLGFRATPLGTTTAIDRSIKRADSQLITEAAVGGLVSARPCTRRNRNRGRTRNDNTRALQGQMRPRQSIDQHTSTKQGPRMVTRNVQRRSRRGSSCRRQCTCGDRVQPGQRVRTAQQQDEHVLSMP